MLTTNEILRHFASQNDTRRTTTTNERVYGDRAIAVYALRGCLIALRLTTDPTSMSAGISFDAMLH
ncbi:MAG TPA: hypothetical protein EYH32_02925 [Anaerolineae bacterium]|nr:hypothetical protein [Anaerolineae bacterium]